MPIKRFSLQRGSRVLHKVGAVLTPADDLIENNIQAKAIKINLATRLELAPSKVSKYLKVRIGQSIDVGQLLCELKLIFGFISSNVYSPVSGIIESFSDKTGELSIRLYSKRSLIKSGLFGTISKIDENFIDIEFNGNSSAGSCGFGSMVFGKGVYIDSNTDVIKILESNDEEIILCCEHSDVLTGINIPFFVKGIIVRNSSLEWIKKITYSDSPLCDMRLSPKISVIILDKFTTKPDHKINNDFLKSFDSTNISLFPFTQIRAGAVRPEVILSMPNSRISI